MWQPLAMTLLRRETLRRPQCGLSVYDTQGWIPASLNEERGKAGLRGETEALDARFLLYQHCHGGTTVLALARRHCHMRARRCSRRARKFPSPFLFSLWLDASQTDVSNLSLDIIYIYISHGIQLRRNLPNRAAESSEALFRPQSRADFGSRTISSCRKTLPSAAHLATVCYCF